MKQKLTQVHHLTGLRQKTVASLLLTGYFLKNEINGITRKTDFTIQQYSVLLLLKRSHDKSQPMMYGDIKRRIAFKRSDVSRLLARLREKGVIDYWEDKTDARIRWCKINKAGLKVLNQINEHENELCRAASLLSVDEAEKLNILLDKVLQVYTA